MIPQGSSGKDNRWPLNVPKRTISGYKYSIHNFTGRIVCTRSLDELCQHLD